MTAVRTRQSRAAADIHVTEWPGSRVTVLGLPGLTSRAKPFLAESVVSEWTGRLPALTAERVQCNHVTMLWAPEVIRAIGG